MTHSVYNFPSLGDSGGESTDRQTEAWLVEELANALTGLESVQHGNDPEASEKALATVAVVLRELEAFRAKTPRVIVKHTGESRN